MCKCKTYVAIFMKHSSGYSQWHVTSHSEATTHLWNLVAHEMNQYEHRFKKEHECNYVNTPIILQLMQLFNVFAGLEFMN